MSAITKEGYLLKYINFFKGWKRRYFILSGTELAYKEKESDMKAKRVYNLNNAEIQMSTKEETELLIIIDKKTITLKTPNVMEKIKWVDSLRQTKKEPKKEEAIREAKSEEKLKQELIDAIQSMYNKEHDSITNAMSKIWSNEEQIEDVLASLMPLIHQQSDPKVRELALSLDQHFINLKTSIKEGMSAVESYKQCINNTIKTDSIEPSNKPLENEDKSNNNEFSEEFFDAIEKEEIKSESNRSDKIELPTRTMLPAQRITLKGVGIWEVLKECIGKDLSHFSVPVYFNEPLSMLQKIAECMENENLLKIASKEPDSLKRTMYVSTFVVSQYYNTEGRVKKPFNPLLGETFEYVTKEFKFFSEQVSHHPPISALYADSNCYELWMHSHVKLHFWGKSLEAIPLGSLYIQLKTTGELFTINRPTSGAYNLIIGKMYVDNSGESLCTNHKTGEKVVMSLHRKGWSESSYANVTGKAYDTQGKEVYIIKGKWTDSLIANGKGETLLLWKGNPRSQNWDQNYFFNTFSLQLNYLTESLAKLIPRTDTRFRPDQRALENGNLKLASTEKVRLEEKQRVSTKKREASKLQFEPQYFEKAYHDITHENYYMFNGKYWKDRETHNWKNTPDLF